MVFLTNKIIVRISGGLGNQLFSYAASRYLAQKNNAELVIDNVSGFINDHEYKRHYQLEHFKISSRLATKKERLEPFSRIRRYLKRTINKQKSFANRSYIQQENIDFDPRLLSVKVHGKLYIEGYWQSENYFKDIEQIIRTDLQIKPPNDKTNQNMANRINNCMAVAVHVRFFDLPDDVNGINNLPEHYYTRAIKKMESLVPDAHYFIFSDKPELVRSLISLSEEQVTYVTQNKGDDLAFADLWLMTKCQHFIIANSTFSWWGAWLSQQKNKIIIAPGFEIRQGKMWWGFDGLLPESWIKL